MAATNEKKVKASDDEDVFTERLFSVVKLIAEIPPQENGGVPIPNIALNYFSLLLGYHKRTDFFEREDNRSTLPNSVMQEICNRTSNSTTRTAMYAILLHAKQYYAEGGHFMFDVESGVDPSTTPEMRASMVPYGWAIMVLTVLFKMDRGMSTLPSRAHLTWIRKVREHFYAILREVRAASPLAALILRIRATTGAGIPMLNMLGANTGVVTDLSARYRSSSSSSLSEESTNRVIEEMERAGMFEDVEGEASAPKAEHESLTNAHLASLKELLGKREKAFLEVEGVARFVQLYRAKFGELCDACVTRPKQCLYEVCGHVFMCRECFVDHYHASSRCPLCNVQSERVLIFP